MNRIRQIPREFISLTIVILSLALFPLLVDLDPFQVSVIVFILYWALLGTAWNIMGGYAGQFSFGHSAYFGIGAYTSTVLLINYEISPWIGMLVGAFFAGIFGFLTGSLTFRYGLKGPYFALATFAFAEMLRLVASETEFINTSIGLHVPLIEGDSWTLIQFNETPQNYYFVILILLSIGLIANIIISRSKSGYYMQAIREDEDAAAALGVNPLRYKVLAVVISAILTAIGGSFFAQFFRFINPDLAFGVAISIEILLRPIVGGAGLIWGPLVGALILTPLGEATRSFVRTPPEFLSVLQGRSGVDEMLFGVILILIIIYMPDGVVGAAQRIIQRMKKSS